MVSEMACKTVTNSKRRPRHTEPRDNVFGCGEGLALPKLGALCKVMSRITLVPKQDHIRRNCWATFFRDPCLFAATYKKANDFNRG